MFAFNEIRDIKANSKQQYLGQYFLYHYKTHNYTSVIK